MNVHKIACSEYFISQFYYNYYTIITYNTYVYTYMCCLTYIGFLFVYVYRMYILSTKQVSKQLE